MSFISTSERARVDLGRIRAYLVELAGDDVPFQQHLLTVFVAEVTARVDGLLAAQREADLEATRQHGHAIQGACANIGASEVAAAAEAMLELARAGETARTAAAADELNALFSSLRERLMTG